MEKNIQDVSWEGWETVRLIGSGSYGSVFEVQRRTGDIIEKAAIKRYQFHRTIVILKKCTMKDMTPKP